MKVPRILVAGLGNIFLGDDAFGVEVVRELRRQRIPEGVYVEDFGIRSYDLAFEIAKGYDAIILVDATSRGDPPGTVSLIKPDLNQLSSGALCGNGHALTPVSVLELTRSLQIEMGRLFLVGCEPAVLETEDLAALSEPVAAAVPLAVEMIQSLIAELRGQPTAREKVPMTKGVVI